jgi:hypothetical protein
MKKAKKRLTALFCALALLLTFSLSYASSGSTTIYLLAVNDKFFDPPGNTLPVSVNGTIYIPYTTFDRSATGVDLGVYYGIDQSRGTVLTLYSLGSMLTFTVKMGLCEDNLGNSMSFHAVSRNGIPYVPAAAVCSFFGLQYSFLPTTDRGTLIRITNPSTTSMSDSMFLSSATNAMNTRYNNLIRGLEPLATPTPAPTAAPTPTPTPSVTGGKENISVFLAVDASQTQEDLDRLFTGSTHALFLFTADSLPAQASLVRKAVAAGHSIGLTVSGTLEEAREQLERGNELLTHIARLKTRIVSAPSSLTSALSEEGWVCWQSNVTGSTAATLMTSLAAKRSVGYVTLPASTSVIRQVLSQIQADGYTLRRPLETEL